MVFWFFFFWDSFLRVSGQAMGWWGRRLKMEESGGLKGRGDRVQGVERGNVRVRDMLGDLFVVV